MPNRWSKGACGSITAITDNDLAAICTLEKHTPSGWSHNQLAGELTQTSGWQFAARLANGELAGYIFGRMAADEAEIIKLAVAPKYQRQGIAASLLDYAFMHLKKHAVQHCYLEFRTSNIAARRLYEKYNFSATGQRKNYYNKPMEDAVCMTKNFSKIRFKIEKH